MSEEKVTKVTRGMFERHLVNGDYHDTDSQYTMAMLRLLGRLGFEIRDLLEPREDDVATPAASGAGEGEELMRLLEWFESLEYREIEFQRVGEGDGDLWKAYGRLRRHKKDQDASGPTLLITLRSLHVKVERTR